MKYVASNNKKERNMHKETQHKMLVYASKSHAEI